MNPLRFVFILLLGLSSCLSFSQQGYLFVKKGYHKKLTYVEGDPIHVKLKDGSHAIGIITLLRNDTVYVNGLGIPRTAIAEILLDPDLHQPFSMSGNTTLVVVGVAAVTTATLLITKEAKEEEALAIGMIAGAAALLVKYVGSRFGWFTRKKFKIGKKYHLQVLEFHITPQKQKAF